MNNDEALTKVFDGHEIRIVQRKGEPWMVGRDVTDALTVHRSQLRRLDDDEKGVHEIHTPGGRQKMVVINEPGAYRLVFSSQKDTARRFKKWLAHDVIPEIRRTGDYVGDGAPTGGDDPTLAALQAAQQIREKQIQQERRLDELEEEQEVTTDRLADIEKTLEEHRAAPDTPTTRFGHEVLDHTWDGMRQAVNRIVTRRQAQRGGNYRDLYLALYDACQREYGFHPKRVKGQRGGPSAIKSLDFDEMRALLQVTRWMYEKGHRV